MGKDGSTADRNDTAKENIELLAKLGKINRIGFDLVLQLKKLDLGLCERPLHIVRTGRAEKTDFADNILGQKRDGDTCGKTGKNRNGPAAGLELRFFRFRHV